MIDEKLLAMIQCPISHQSLVLADPELIENLNQKIAQGTLRDTSDQVIEIALDEGLLSADGARLYPVRGGIPTLIADNAIDLE